MLLFTTPRTHDTLSFSYWPIKPLAARSHRLMCRRPKTAAHRSRNANFVVQLCGGREPIWFVQRQQRACISRSSRRLFRLNLPDAAAGTLSSTCSVAQREHTTATTTTTTRVVVVVAPFRADRAAYRLVPCGQWLLRLVSLYVLKLVPDVPHTVIIYVYINISPLYTPHKSGTFARSRHIGRRDDEESVLYSRATRRRVLSPLFSTASMTKQLRRCAQITCGRVRINKSCACDGGCGVVRAGLYL